MHKSMTALHVANIKYRYIDTYLCNTMYIPTYLQKDM